MKTDGLRSLWKEAFGDTDAFLDSFFEKGFAPERCRCLGDTAAVYWLDHSFTGGRVAYLYALAVRESHRGQGLARRLMTETLEHLRHQGYAGALLVPATEALGEAYRRMGFTETIPMYRWPELSLPDRLTAEEYFRRRAELLPVGGLQPAAELWDFYGDLYEFYGDSRRILGKGEGGIVEIWGADPAEEAGFAQYAPLNSRELPTWFALACD